MEDIFTWNNITVKYRLSEGGLQTPLFLNTPTFSSVKLYQNAILHIDEEPAVGKAMILCIFPKDCPLVGDGVALAFLVVFVGKAAVERGDQLWIHFVILLCWISRLYAG